VSEVDWFTAHLQLEYLIAFQYICMNGGHLG